MQFVIRNPSFVTALLGTQATHLFPQSFASQGLFNALLFARLQVERVLLYVLDDIFLLNLTLEAPQSALEGFTFV